MKYILYFGGYDNNIYFYKTIEELLNDWDCKTLEEFINMYKNNLCGISIFKISSEIKII